MKISKCKSLESESPGYIPCTQEGFENIDVVWDWNSPQSKRIPKKSQKRLALSQSPKTTLKRHLSNNSIQGFEKLQEELRLLREEIAVPEHEDCLVLSPIEEAEYKNVNNSESIYNIELENLINEADDFFDDSLDEQLLICTTQVESNLNEVPVITSHNNSYYNWNNNYQIRNKKVETNSVIIPDYEEISKNKNNPSKCLERNFGSEKSIKNCRDSTVTKNKECRSDNKFVTIGKVEFHRTQSFEMSSLGNTICRLI